MAQMRLERPRLVDRTLTEAAKARRVMSIASDAILASQVSRACHVQISSLEISSLEISSFGK
jgi:hypothetical protein